LLLDIAQMLGQSVDDLLQWGQEGSSGTGDWVLHRKKDQQPVQRIGKRAKTETLEVLPLLPTDGQARGIIPYLLRLGVGSEGTRSFFDHKGPEFGWVLNGIVKIVGEYQEVILRKGDSLYLENQPIKRWRNEGTSRCELVWILV
jgi:hypothetical protein